MAVNKVIFGGDTLIDLTEDTVDAYDVAQGVVFHLPTGVQATGLSTLDSDTTDATALVAEILSGRTAYARGSKLTGTMPNNGSVYRTFSTIEDSYTIAQGYHDGGGLVDLSPVECAKMIPGNIKVGVSLFGVTGNYSGESISVQSKTATPDVQSQTILPDIGYDYLSQVTVEAIPYEEVDNVAGGVTAIIG